MPDIEFAFLADAADARPGQKFNVLGGGIDRIGGATFPLVQPHLALVIGLRVYSTELNREHEIKFVVLDAAGRELTAGVTNVVASGEATDRDSLVSFAVDLWSLSFPAPGDYSFRLLVDGSERKRLPLGVIARGALPVPPVGDRRFDA